MKLEEQTFREKLDLLINKIEEHIHIAKLGGEGIRSYIQTINAGEASQVSRIQLYKFHLIREKGLYDNLNKLIKGK